MRATGAMRLGATLGEPHAGLARAADACPRPPAVQGTRGRGEVVGMAWEAGRALLQVRRAPPLRATTIWKGAYLHPAERSAQPVTRRSYRKMSRPPRRGTGTSGGITTWSPGTISRCGMSRRHACLITEFVRNSSEIPVIAASLCCWPAPLGLPEF